MHKKASLFCALFHMFFIIKSTGLKTYYFIGYYGCRGFAMKISTKGRYALCVMLDLAEHCNEGLISLKDISDRQNISKKYLEQIVALLNRPGILKTVRGSRGGYALARTPDKYTVGEILELAEGSLSPVPNLEDPSELAATADSQFLPVWQGLYEVVNNYLSGITLQDILDRQMEGYDYSI